MRRELTEDLLALFTARDVSASIVGDLLEQAPARRRGWFTFEVVRLAFALCFRSLVSAPARALRLALVGLVVYAGTYAVLFIAMGLPWYPWHRVYEFGFAARLGAVTLVANLVAGAILARLPTGAGFSAIAPLTALWLAGWLSLAAVHLVSSVQPWSLIGGGWRGTVFVTLLFPVLYLLPLLLGAVFARRRAVSIAPHKS